MVHRSQRDGKASCSSAYRQLMGARTGGAACLRLAQRHRFWRLLRCESGGGRKGPHSATSRLGAATGKWVEAAAARRGRTCWIASVCSCAARNCWAMLPVASPKRPVWETGTLKNRTLSASLCHQTQPEVALLNHKCGHRTTQRPWREVRCGTEFFQNFRIVTTPVHVPQCF